MAEQSLFSMLIEKRPGNFAEQIVYENEHVVAFLDKFPMVAGHTLVVPKKQVAKMHELDEQTAAAMGVAVAQVSAKVVEATGMDNYNLLTNNGAEAGQEVFHVHVHIIPRRAGDFSASWVKSIEQTRSLANPKPDKLPDAGDFEGELKILRDKLRA